MDQEHRLVAMAINGVIASTQSISHNFLPTSFYYVYDVFETFVQRTNSKLALSQFLHILKKVDCVVVLEGHDAGMSIVCLRSSFDQNTGLQILSSDAKTGDDVQSNNIRNIYDKMSEDSDNVLIQAVESKDSSKKEKRSKERASRKKVQKENNKSAQDSKTTLDSKQHSAPSTKTYKDTRGHLLAAFRDGVMLSLPVLHAAFIRVHGFAFVYKKLPCKNGFHPHTSLSKYISCCKDIFEIKKFGNNTYIKRVDYDAKVLVERRRNMHIPQLATPASRYHLELLLVNMFPIKVKVEYDDLIGIFKEVYDISLNSLCNGDPKNAISKLDTPNIYLTNSKKNMVVLVPSWTSSYKSFGDSSKVLHTSVPDLKTLSKENLVSEEVEKQNTGVNLCASNRYLASIFGSCGPLLDVAGSNVPRCLQKQQTASDTLSLFRLCDLEGGLCLQWGYINQCVKINNKNTFFDIG